MKKLYLLLALVLVFTSAFATGCNSKPSVEDVVDYTTTGNYPVATITLNSNKKIVLELYPDVAPNTVNNFISLANSGFYDGTCFHRGQPNFFIQGGGASGTGMDSPGYRIKGEFATNGFENKLKHERGVISMARTGDLDGGGCQFFIMSSVYPAWDGSYAGFGKVISGQEVVDEISNQPTTSQLFNEKIIIKSITVDTLGVTYPEPETIAE